jgi:hypothetical protein
LLNTVQVNVLSQHPPPREVGHEIWFVVHPLGTSVTMALVVDVVTGAQVLLPH